MSKQKCFLIVAGLAVVNHFLIKHFFGTDIFVMCCAILAMSGGWLLVARANTNLWVAALTGVFILTVDHVLLNGGWFLIAQIVWPEKVQNMGFLAFGGVLVSFVMLAPVAAAFSFIGGLIGRTMRRG